MADNCDAFKQQLQNLQQLEDQYDLIPDVCAKPVPNPITRDFESVDPIKPPAFPGCGDTNVHVQRLQRENSDCPDIPNLDNTVKGSIRVFVDKEIEDYKQELIAEHGECAEDAMDWPTIDPENPCDTTIMIQIAEPDEDIPRGTRQGNCLEEHDPEAETYAAGPAAGLPIDKTKRRDYGKEFCCDELEDGEIIRAVFQLPSPHIDEPNTDLILCCKGYLRFTDLTP